MMTLANGTPASDDDDRNHTCQQHELEWMEAKATRRIQGHVGMVYPVEAPEESNRVHRDVQRVGT